MRQKVRWLLVSSILLATFVPALTAWARNQSATSHATTRLYIVFLPGLCGYPHSDPDCSGKGNAAIRARHTFGTLISVLSSAHVRYTPVYYSYNFVHSNAYSIGDTQQSISRSVAALNRQVQSITAADAGARIDLVAHSLGGVIAADWAVTLGRRAGTGPRRGLRSFVHNLVTFDSPLKGIQSNFLGNLLSKIFGGKAWLDLQPDSAIVRQITGQTSNWWQVHGHLHTIANRADIIVPPGEALLGVQHVVTDESCSRDLGILSSCHGAVLADRGLNRFVACNWITDGQQCNAPTATPLPPTLTATSTETPTVIATPTMTVTPTNTETPTATPVAIPTLPRPQPTLPPPPTAPPG